MGLFPNTQWVPSEIQTLNQSSLPVSLWLELVGPLQFSSVRYPSTSSPFASETESFIQCWHSLHFDFVLGSVERRKFPTFDPASFARLSPLEVHILCQKSNTIHRMGFHFEQILPVQQALSRPDRMSTLWTRHPIVQYQFANKLPTA